MVWVLVCSMVWRWSDQSALRLESLTRDPLCLESLIRGNSGLECLIRVNFRLENLIRDNFGLESLIRHKFGSGPQPVKSNHWSKEHETQPIKKIARWRSQQTNMNNQIHAQEGFLVNCENQSPMQADAPECYQTKAQIFAKQSHFENCIWYL